MEAIVKWWWWWWWRWLAVNVIANRTESTIDHDVDDKVETCACAAAEPRLACHKWWESSEKNSCVRFYSSQEHNWLAKSATTSTAICHHKEKRTHSAASVAITWKQQKWCAILGKGAIWGKKKSLNKFSEHGKLQQQQHLATLYHGGELAGKRTTTKTTTKNASVFFYTAAFSVCNQSIISIRRMMVVVKKKKKKTASNR